MATERILDISFSGMPDLLDPPGIEEQCREIAETCLHAEQTLPNRDLERTSGATATFIESLMAIQEIDALIFMKEHRPDSPLFTTIVLMPWNGSDSPAARSAVANARRLMNREVPPDLRTGIRYGDTGEEGVEQLFESARLLHAQGHARLLATVRLNKTDTGSHRRA